MSIRIRAIAPFACLLLFSCDPGRQLDHDDPLVEIVVSSDYIYAGVPVGLDCVVNEGDWDDWSYEWQLPPGSYETSYRGARVDWIPAAVNPQGTLKVTVSNDSARMEEWKHIRIDAPPAPGISILPPPSPWPPGERGSVECVLEGDQPLPEIQWSASSGSFTDPHGITTSWLGYGSGQVELQVTASLGASTTTEYSAFSLLEMPPVIEIMDSHDQIVQPGGAIRISAICFDPNLDTLSMEWSFAGGVFDECLEHNEFDQLFLNALFHAGESPGTHELRLTITDGRFSTFRSLEIDIQDE